MACYAHWLAGVRGGSLLHYSTGVRSITPSNKISLLHYSITPILQYSNTPIITPLLRLLKKQKPKFCRLLPCTAEQICGRAQLESILFNQLPQHWHWQHLHWPPQGRRWCPDVQERARISFCAVDVCKSQRCEQAAPRMTMCVDTELDPGAVFQVQLDWSTDQLVASAVRWCGGKDSSAVVSFC